MRTHFVKFYSAIVMGPSLFILTSSVAFCAEDPALTGAANAASHLNEAVSSSVEAPTTNCEDQILPDAPGFHTEVKKHNGIGDDIFVSASVGVTENPKQAGSISPKGTFAVNLAIGGVDLTQMMGKLGITAKPGHYFNFKYAASPMTFSTANAAGNGEIQEISAEEGADTWWGAADIQTAKDRLAKIKKDSLTQEISGSAALVTKNGTVFECKAGKAPEVAVPAADPNGVSNKPELLSGSSNAATRVGSSYSTLQVQCVEAKSLGKDSKLQFSFLVYRNTIPYVEENSNFADKFGQQDKSYKETNGLKLPNSARAGVQYSKSFGKDDKNNIGANATVGETEGHLTYSANFSAVTGRNTAFAGLAQSYYPNFVTAQPEKQTGQYAGDSFRLFSHLSAFGTYEKDIGSPNCATSLNQDCSTDFEIKKAGVQWYVTGKKKGIDSQTQTRWIVGAAYQETESLDNSLNDKSKGESKVFYLKYSYSGAPFKRKHKDREPAADDVPATAPVQQ